MKIEISNYIKKYQEALERVDWAGVERLLEDLRQIRISGKTVYLFGNGGSAANAMHWANDLLYPLTKSGGKPIRALALTADVATLTCLGNDIGYDQIFAFQLDSLAVKGDLVIALSGSGNSANIHQALRVAKEKQLTSYAILGYDGGQAKKLASRVLHLPAHDMQLAEDFQLMVCHLVLQTLEAET